MDDLLKATGYAAIVYLLFNYLISFGSGRPLVEWINPGRHYLPLLALTMLGGAYGSLRVAALRTPEKSQVELLKKLITEEKAPAEVVGAMSLFTFSVAILLLAGWCWWTLPRAPQTFSANPKDLLKEYTRALKHYVRWKGGLDYAIICEVRNGQLEVVATAAADWDILRGLNRLPGVHTEINKAALPLVTEQKKSWNDLALALFQKWPEYEQLMNTAKQGRTIAIQVDLRYGAVFAEMLEEAVSQPNGTQVGIFLFTVSLNQYEVNILMAHKHFSMLSQAIRHIRTGISRK
jgi:hypothetical protein